MKTELELKELALDVFSGRAVTSHQIAHLCEERGENVMGMVFMPLLMMDKQQFDWLKSNDVAMLYEYMENALPRSINGLPCFMAFHTLNAEEYELFATFINELQTTTEAFLSPEEGQA